MTATMELPNHKPDWQNWWPVALIVVIATVLGAGQKIWAIVRDACKAVWHAAMLPSRISENLERIAAALEKLRAETVTEFAALKAGLKSTRNIAILNEKRTLFNLRRYDVPLYECALPGGSCVWVNEALAELFGMSVSDCLGYGWQRAIHADDVDRIRKQWDETIKHWMPYRVRYRIVVDGKVITVEATAEAFSNDDGEPLTAWGQVVPVPVTT